MGTSNFYTQNATKTFAICMDYEDEETGETISCTSEDCDDTLGYVRDLMEENKEYEYHELDGSPLHDDRNFSGRQIGSWRKYKMYGDVEVCCHIEAISRNGYYEGACLDWEIEIHVDGNTEDEIKTEDFTYNSNMSEGLCTMLAKKAQRWVDITREKMVDDIEKLFTQVAMPLVVVARFSNGETIYEKA